MSAALQRHFRVMDSAANARPSEFLGTEILMPMGELNGPIARPPLELAATPEEGYAREDTGDFFIGPDRCEVKHLLGTVFSPSHWPYSHFFTWAPHKWEAMKVKPAVLVTLSADLRAYAFVWDCTRPHWYVEPAFINNAGVRSWQDRLCCPLDLVHFYPMPADLREQYLDLVPAHYR